MDQNLCERSTSIVEDEIITGTFYQLAFYYGQKMQHNFSGASFTQIQTHIISLLCSTSAEIIVYLHVLNYYSFNSPPAARATIKVIDEIVVITNMTTRKK